MTTVLVSAGDASGDLHASAFVDALRRRLGEVRVLGIGGRELERSGCALVAHQRDLAVGGLVEVLGSLRRIVGAWRRLVRALDREHPDLVVLVDSPDFNLPFARRARARGIPVLYYVSPQVWAWRRGRIRKVARRVDRLAVIFPFETEVYAGTELDAEFVGHPLVDRLRLPRREERRAARVELGLDPERPLVLLLPGSRRNELRHGLALHLEVARRLHRRDPRRAFALAVAPSLDRDAVQAQLDRAGLPPDLRLDVIAGDTHAAMRAADLAIAKPGTTTLELALLDTPMVVAGRAHALTVWLARRLVRVPAFAMPNLVAGRHVVPEFIQEDARPERVADAAEALLGPGPAREAQRAALRGVREALGQGGAAARAAEIAEEMIRGPARRDVDAPARDAARAAGGPARGT